MLGSALFSSGVLLLACSTVAEGRGASAKSTFESETIASLDEPWALAFLPDGRMLVTLKRGRIRLVSPDGAVSEPLDGVPDVSYAGQGGLGDIVLHPDFARNRLVYISYVEAGSGRTRGAVVARARLELGGERGRLEELEVIWRQTPKVSGAGHYGHRLAFSPDGFLFVSSGERQKFEPAQNMSGNLGKIVRLYDDGGVPADNPFSERGSVAAQVWSLGHRNPLGLAFDTQGRLWNVEMGPRGGDELNLVERGANYGYPLVSNGDHYDGRPIPDHDTRPEFVAPKAWWSPVISPGSLCFYSGDRFAEWRGDALIAGLSSNALIRVQIDGQSAREVERFDMGARIRTVAQGPSGALWVLEDGAGARLLRLTPG